MAQTSFFCSVCGTMVSDPIARQYGKCPTCGSSLKTSPGPVAPRSVGIGNAWRRLRSAVLVLASFIMACGAAYYIYCCDYEPSAVAARNAVVKAVSWIVPEEIIPGLDSKCVALELVDAIASLDYARYRDLFPLKPGEIPQDAQMKLDEEALEEWRTFRGVPWGDDSIIGNDCQVELCYCGTEQCAAPVTEFRIYAIREPRGLQKRASAIALLAKISGEWRVIGCEIARR